jgi:hypothetical protein
MPDHSRRRPDRSSRPEPRPRLNRNPALQPGNQDRLGGLQPASGDTEERVRFAGLGGMSGFLSSDRTARSGDLSESRGAAAAKAGLLTYQEGVELYGAEGSWETDGSNRGTLVDEIQETNGSSGGQAWCGMFVGDSYQKAGIRQEIIDRLVFWSGYRLHLFFTQGRYIDGAFGDWWQAHQTSQIGSGTGDARKAKLDAFAPRAGDVVLFRSDYSHVGMVTGYDSSTGTLEVVEGNRGNRVQATAYDTGDGQITFIGRFNSSDYEPGGSVDREVSRTPNVTHSGSGSGSIQ